MPVYQSNTKLSFNHCIHVDFHVQNGPEAMKDNLGSAANIIHVLLNTSNRRNIRRIRRNTYKHPRWGFMYWLDPEASTPIAFQGFAQWHRQGLLTLSQVISTALSAAELRAAIVNLVLLYPADPSTVPVSNSPAITSIVRQFCPISRPVEAPAPATDDWQPFSYEGWSKKEIQRHRQAFDPDYRQEEEMLYSFSEWL
ncbi:hypothetical protein BN14_12251 [Rhizoctonia solani AG-1 IB]|uniref:Uncharacterized protein n=1 Tax=Thanatephorus cucumeris (strain AG1-IB / isolate 7/3/14) TaxID=1108050 RepID=M5CF63_THACB|nr:hypothetical protein BN14_12251 [Rhizoctonia solani AG-1 IB]